MSDWQTEVAELHSFFEAYFLGSLPDDLARVDAALAPDFTMVSPNGNQTSRKQVMSALAAGYQQASSLRITTTDYQLLYESEVLVVAAYIETHNVADSATHRRSTVVFTRDVDGPNGLRWLRVHECWIDSGTR